MIRFQDLTIQRGTKVLFNRTTATLNPGEKVGLIGANGAGKSTLFSLLRGEIHADGGDFGIPPTWRIAHVAQETPAVERTALDYTLDGDLVLRKIEAEIERASAAHDGNAEGNAHAAYADADGYTAASRAEALLMGLGFTLAQINQSVASFSGGWRMRLNLAQALMAPSDLLLLDEPTNHLDLDAIVWLEEWLTRYPGTLVVISHDREFLDAVCNVTLHIDAQQLKRYGGNYTQFETIRAQQLTLQQSSYEKQQRQVDHLQSYINRFKAQATKARQAQSRIKALERMDMLAPVREATSFTFKFRTPDAAPNPMLLLDDVSCGYHTPEGDKAILKHISISVQPGQRIGLLGANGQGKSTLVKTLAAELAALQGDITTGKGLQIGYFAQHQLETLRDDDTPLQHLMRIAPTTREQELRNFLGSFNFNGEMATSPIRPFSGGEKARLALSLIVWQKPNLLLLDEPTNHLDLETREALTMALAQFEGTMIVVSHDRHLLRATADNFILVGNGGMEPFDGDLDDYRDWLLQHATDKRNEAKGIAKNAVAEAKAAAKREAEKTKEADPALRKEQKRLEAEARQQAAAQRKPLQRELEKTEKLVATLTEDKMRLEAILADETSYLDANKALLTKSLKEQGDVASQLEAAEMRWLELHEQLEGLAA